MISRNSVNYCDGFVDASTINDYNTSSIHNDYYYQNSQYYYDRNNIESNDESTWPTPLHLPNLSNEQHFRKY